MTSQNALADDRRKDLPGGYYLFQIEPDHMTCSLHAPDGLHIGNIRSAEASCFADSLRAASSPAPDVTVEEIAREIAISYGQDPYDLAQRTVMCDANGFQVPWWMVYEEQARAVLSLLQKHRPATTRDGGKKMKPPRVDLTGRRVGRLVVKSYLGIDERSKRSTWACVCDCGASTNVTHCSLARASTQSCGCLNREVASSKATRHGGARRGQKTRAFMIWQGMIARCTNPSRPEYHQYGGAGIVVCERWTTSFEAFLVDMGNPPKGMSIDRIDGSGNYEPGNCRWATAAQQVRNSSRAKLNELQAAEIKNALQESDLTQSEVASRYGVSRSTISHIAAGRCWGDV